MAKRELTKASGTSAGNGAIRPVSKDVGGMADFLTANVKQIAASCSTAMTPEMVIRLARTMFHKSPSLLECDPITILGGVIQSAAIGLELDEFTGAAYLVPFWNSNRGVSEAQLMIGYRGYMRLARRSGEVTNIEGREVRSADQFDVILGTDAKIVHIPSRERPKGNAEDEDQFQAFYVCAEIKGGTRPQFDFMWTWEVQEIRDAVKKKNGGKLSPAWRGHFAEMGKKSVVRRMSKYLPIALQEFQRAVTLDDLASNGMAQGLAAFVNRDELVSGSMPIPEEETRRIDEDEESGSGTDANNVGMRFEATLAETIDAMLESGSDAADVAKTIKRRKASAMAEVANDQQGQAVIAEIAARYLGKYGEANGSE